MQKKVAVLGPVPRDHIFTHKGEQLKRYGAALHTSVVLSNLLEENGEVFQVSHVQKVDYNAVIDILKPFTNVNTNYISQEADRGDVVTLRFLDQNRRIEKQTGFMPPITEHDVANLLDCDAFVCVPITDYEIPLETLKYIKENSKGQIIFDAHGPTTGLSTKGDRFLKFWADRDNWLPYIDVLKMNLEESRASWFKNEYTLAELEVDFHNDKSHLNDFAQHCLAKGLKCLIVTLDESGAALFYLENEKLVSTIVSPVKVEHVVDTTGCGDSFAGGLGFGFVAYPNDYEMAVRYANAAGALRTQGNDFSVFKSKKETDIILKKNHL